MRRCLACCFDRVVTSEALLCAMAMSIYARGLLTVRRTKFAKSRKVPLHPSAIQALSRYRRVRKLYIERDAETPFSERPAASAWSAADQNVRSSASSRHCAISWAGSIAVHTMPRACTICGTASSCGA